MGAPDRDDRVRARERGGDWFLRSPGAFALQAPLDGAYLWTVQVVWSAIASAPAVASYAEVNGPDSAALDRRVMIPATRRW